MKNWVSITVCVLVHCSLVCSAQTQTLAEINDRAVAMMENGDEGKALLLLQKIDLTLDGNGAGISRTHCLLGELYENNGYSQLALRHYTRCFQVSDSRELKAIAATGIANAFTTAGKYDSVDFFVRTSINLDDHLRNRVLNEIALGRLWQSQNLTDSSLHYWHLARDNAKTIEDKKLQAMALSGMAGASFSSDPGMKRVLQFLKESSDLCDSSKHANILARNYGRFANALMVLGNTKEAERYLNRAKAIVDISGNLPVKSYVMSSFAILKAEQGDIPAALRFSEEPLRIKKELGQLRSLQNDLLNISEWQTLEHSYIKARESINEGISTSTTLGDVVYLQYFYDRLSKLDSITGDHRSAYANLRRSLFYKDSVQSTRQFRAVEEVRQKYETEQQKKLLAEKEVEIERQRLTVVSLVAVALVIILLFVVTLVVVKTNHRKKIQKQKDAQQRLQLETIVQTQEEVQQSIARDLHDGLVQIIGAAKMSLESVVADTDTAVARTRVSDASRIMDQAVNEARNISHQMLPYSLMKGGLESALEDLLSKSLRNYKFQKLSNPVSISEDVSIHVFRIVQELVNNVVKHAEADRVDLSLESNSTALTIKFEDNGKGFDTRMNQGVGLTNIQTRTQLLHGQLHISSEIGGGTKVTLTIPL